MRPCLILARPPCARFHRHGQAALNDRVGQADSQDSISRQIPGGRCWPGPASRESRKRQALQNDPVEFPDPDDLPSHSIRVRDAQLHHHLRGVRSGRAVSHRAACQALHHRRSSRVVLVSWSSRALSHRRVQYRFAALHRAVRAACRRPMACPA